MLAHIFYISKSTFAAHNVVDQDILHQARQNNPRLELTGCLFRAPEVYAQILEGPMANIEHMMDVIRSDPRHYEIVEWRPTQTPRRFFPDWSMGYARNDASDAQLLAFGHAQERQISEIAGILKDVFEADYG